MRSGHSSLFAVAIALLACSGESLDEDKLEDGIFTAEEWENVQSLSGLPDKPPPDPTNKYSEDEAAAAFGQKLFYSPDFAGPIITGDNGENGGLGEPGEAGKVACSSCHVPPWFTDTRSIPNSLTLGTDWIPRNTPTLVNNAYLEGFRDWEGISDTLWIDGLGGVENPAFVGSTRLRVAHGLYEQYREEYDAIFDEPLDPALDPSHPDAARFPAEGGPKASPDAPDGAWEMMAEEDQRIINRIFVNYGKAIAAYIHKLTSTNAPFDRYVAGDRDAISKSAKRGLKLFVGKANCIECHKGPNFTDEDFHNTTHVSKYPEEVTPGVAELWGALTDFFDQGHFMGINYALNNPLNRDSEYSDDRTTPLLKDLEAKPEHVAAYRTSPLRNIAETGPYMHDGQFETLEEVMKFYNDGGNADGFAGEKDELMEELNLTDEEIADLVAFMKTLTGEPIDESLLGP